MYFTLTSVLSYFEGFKLALFNVIFYPKSISAELKYNSYTEFQFAFLTHHNKDKRSVTWECSSNGRARA